MAAVLLVEVMGCHPSLSSQRSLTTLLDWERFPLVRDSAITPFGPLSPPMNAVLEITE